MKKIGKIVNSLAMLYLFAFVLLLPTTVKAAGNSISTATAAALNSSVSGTLTESNNVDWYKIQITSSGRVTFKLQANKMDDVTWGIWRSVPSESKMFSNYTEYSSTKGENTDTFYVDLTRGTYYVYIERCDSPYHSCERYGNYVISNVYEDAKESFSESGEGQDDNILHANKIALNTAYKGQIAYDDLWDFYGFKLDKPGHITLDMDLGTAYRFWVHIYDASDAKLYDETFYYDSSYGKNIGKIDLDLTAGEYFFEISGEFRYSTYQTGPYSFKITYTDANETFPESGNGKNQNQQSATPVDMNKAYIGQLARTDNSDYYKFSVPHLTRVYIDYKSQMQWADLRVYNVSGDQKYSERAYFDDNLGQAHHYEYVDLEAGTYAFAVTSDCTGPYSFKLISHSHAKSEQKITKATSYYDGKIEWYCECGELQSSEVISHPEKIVLKKTSLVYNKKAQKPTVKVKSADGKTIGASNYKVKYPSGTKNVGNYTVKVVLDNPYYDATLDATYQIAPKATKITKINGSTRGFKIKYSKLAKTQATGYQIQYSMNKKFTSSGTYTVPKYKTGSATVKYLYGRRNYYVRVRAYKNTKSGTVYSAWSKTKKVKTK